MMSKPKYIVILTGLFCSVVAVNILARIDFFGMKTLAFGLASQAQVKNGKIKSENIH